MRWIGRVCVLLTPLALWTSGVMGADIGSTTCVACGQGTGYYAPACGAPCYGGQPGCCENPPSPCDNAWDGYCQEKARRDAFWSRVGTGTALCGLGSCTRCQPTMCVESVACGAEAAYPMPAAAPMTPSDEATSTAPVSPPDAPLPPEPDNLDEPSALPPILEPASANAAQPWYRSWLPRMTAG